MEIENEDMDVKKRKKNLTNSAPETNIVEGVVYLKLKVLKWLAQARVSHIVGGG